MCTALVTAIVTLSGSSPTGERVVDVALIACISAVMVTVGSRASDTVLLVGSGLALIGSIGAIASMVAAFAAWAFVAQAIARRRPLDRGWHAVIVTLTLISAFTLPSFRFGASAVVATLIFSILVYGGVRRSDAHARRVLLFGTIFVAELIVVLTGLALATITRARHEVADAARQIEDGFDALLRGDDEVARAQLDTAAANLEAASGRVGAWWAQGAALVPVVAQHHRLLTTLAEEASTLVGAARTTLTALDPREAQMVNGTIDIEAVKRMAGPLDELTTTIEEFASRLDEVSSPWLVAPARERLDEATEVMTDNLPRVRAVNRVVQRADALLGADGERTYLVIFVTPAEARPGGGHFGNYGELTVSGGHVTLSRFDRAGTFAERLKDESRRMLDGPESFIERYAAFGVGDGRPAGRGLWQVATIDPHFPNVGDVLQQLYRAGSGTEVDGVIGIDPVGLSSLLRVTGPIELDDGLDLTAENIAGFLLRDQYEITESDSNEARIDLLGDAGRLAFDRLLSTPNVNPLALLDAFRPAILSGHFRAWSSDVDLQTLFSELGASGSFELSAPSDAIAITNLNGGGNKLDAFLQRSVEYDAVVDTETGAIEATLDVTLENTAPTSGLPSYVIGSIARDPAGTNRTFVTGYSRVPVVGLEVDGRPVELLPPAAGTQLGWQYGEWRVLVPSGGTTRLTFRLEGTLPAAAPYSLFWHQQPMVNPDEIRVRVTSTDGEVLVEFDGRLDRSTTIGP